MTYNVFSGMLNPAQSINVTDGQTDRHTTTACVARVKTHWRVSRERTERTFDKVGVWRSYRRQYIRSHLL